MKQGKRIVLAGVAASAGAAAAALAGWYFGIPILARLGAGYIPMAPSTAALLLLFAGALGATCLFPGRKWALRLRRAAAAFGTLASLALLVLSSLKIYIEFEHLGLPVPPGAGDFPLGHMSPATALCLMLAGLSLLAAPNDPEQSSEPTPWSLLPACMLVAASGVMALAYIFGSPVLYSGGHIPPAATTVAALFALSVAEASAAWPRRDRSLAPDRAGRREAGLLLLTFLGLSAGILGAGQLSYRHYEQHSRTEARRQLDAVAELKVSELVQWREERLADAAGFFDNPAFLALARPALSSAPDAEALRLLQGWIESHQRYENYNRIALLDPRGIERLAAPADATAPDSALVHDSRSVLAAREITFLDFYRHAPDGGIRLGLVVPIFDQPGAGQPLGFLLLSMDPARRLYPSLLHWPIPSRSAETQLVRREGNEALILNELRFDKDAALALRFSLDRTESPAVAAVLGQSGPREGVDYRGVSVAADTRAVPGSPWFLVTQMDLAEVSAPLRERLWLTVALMAALLLGAGGGLGFLWRRRALGFYRERLAAEDTIARLNAGLEQRVAERTVQLEGAVHELETFAYSVSHDLRAPLRAIEGFAGMLAQDYAAVLDAEGHRLLAVVRANARRMDALITDLLTLSRLTRSELHSARIDMSALAGEVFRAVASPQELQAVSFAADGLPEAWGDPSLVRQVWSNLFANALKFSRPKPQRRILVEGRVAGAMAVYTVSDSGVGFDQAYVHKLFGAFERLHRLDEFEGTGIGLAIVKRIVQRHGGQVLARGTPGEGAAFTFSLPARAPQGATGA